MTATTINEPDNRKLRPAGPGGKKKGKKERKKKKRKKREIDLNQAASKLFLCLPTHQLQTIRIQRLGNAGSGYRQLQA
jgi:hypothetical protein